MSQSMYCVICWDKEKKTVCRKLPRFLTITLKKKDPSFFKDSGVQYTCCEMYEYNRERKKPVWRKFSRLLTIISKKRIRISPKIQVHRTRIVIYRDNQKREKSL